MTAPPLDDHQLMLAVRDGDVRQLGELFERHHRPLYGFFVRLTSQRTQSEDLVQQVFFRILKYRHTYRDEGNFRAWIYHLARKVVADHYRKSRGDGITTTDEFAVERVPDANLNSSERAVIEDDLDLMRRAFARLEISEREVLTLHRFQHLSHQEIAQLLGCSAGAAKVRTHRALKALREIYLSLQSPRPDPRPETF